MRRFDSQKNRGEQPFASWKKKAVRFLAGFVVFATTYSLILPAITLDIGTAEQEPGISVSTATESEATPLPELTAEPEQSEEPATPENSTAPETGGASEATPTPEQPEISPTPSEGDVTGENDPAEQTEGDSEETDAETADETEDESDGQTEEENPEEEAEESDPTADVETEEDWAEMFTPLLRGLDWSQHLVALARAQLDYGESSANFTEDENGVRHGYTRYGAWCGDPYGDWNGSFVAFCLNYAEIPAKAMPRDTDAARYAETLEKCGMYAPSGEYTPRAGDLVFFDTDNDPASIPELVGIVVSSKADEEGKGSIHAIMGIPGERVKESRYASDALAICGYGILPENPDIRLLAMPAQTFTGETDKVKVLVTADAGAFPAGTTMTVKPVVDAATLAAMAAAAKGTPGGVLAVDISFFDSDGNEIEPAIPVRVSLSSKLVETAKEPVVVHVDDAGEAQVVEQLDGQTAQDEVVFSAGGFSVYGIVDSIVTEYLSANGNLYNVIVSYDQSAQIPDGATVSITEFDETDETYLEARAALLKSMGEDEETVELNMTALDITLHDAGGAVIEPAAPVRVQLTIKALPGVEDLEEIKDLLQIQHHVPNGDNTIVETVFSGDSTGSFSLKSDEAIRAAYTALYGGTGTDTESAEAGVEASGETAEPAEQDTEGTEQSTENAEPGTESVEQNTEPAGQNAESVEESAEQGAEPAGQEGLTASFETDSFSVFTVKWGTATAASALQNNTKYIIYAPDASDGKLYALKPNGADDPIAVEVTIQDGLISYPGGNKNDLYWTVTTSGNGANKRFTFSYTAESRTYYLGAGTNNYHVISKQQQGNYGSGQTTAWGQWSDYLHSADNTFLQCHEGVFRVRNVSGIDNWMGTSNIYFEKQNPSISEITVHYVDESYNELPVLRGNTSSASKFAYLIYDIEGYDYVRTVRRNRSGGTATEVYPLIQISDGKILTDPGYYNSQTDYGDPVYQSIPSNQDIYVIYKQKKPSTVGSDPVPIQDESVAQPPQDPSVSKSSVINGDGTNTISLTVIGHNTSIKSYKLADVLIVFDRSGSMAWDMAGNDASGDSRRIAIAKRALNDLADQLFAKNGTGDFANVIRMGLVSFSNTATQEIGFTNNKASFKAAVNGLSPGGGTNWESALKIADEMAADTQRATYVIFVTDGDPTFRYSRMTDTDTSIEAEGVSSGGYGSYYPVYNVYGAGNDDPNDRNFEAALAYSQSIVGNNKRFYSIGISQDVTNLERFTAASGVSADHCVVAANEAELQKAFNDIGASILGLWGHSDLDIVDGITELTQTVEKTQLAGVLPDEDNFLYYRGKVATQDDVDNGLAAHVGDIYGWESWNPASEGCGLAIYDDTTGSVEWKMGSSFIPLEGYAYRVDFKVWPSQEAYDIIAKLNNGVLTMDDANQKILNSDGSEAYDTDIYNQISGSYPNYYLKTNTSASHSFSQATNTGGKINVVDGTEKTKPIDYDVPDLSLVTQPLKVQKNWQASMYGSNLTQKPSSLDIDLYTKDGGSSTTIYKTITLGPPIGAGGRPDKTVNEWKNDSDPCYVSYGLIKRGGSGLTIYETGHDFTLIEHYDQSSTSDLLKSHYWHLNPGTYRPMVIGVGNTTRKTILERIDNPVGIELGGTSPGYWHDSSGALESRYMKDTYPSYTGDYYWLEDADGVFHAYIDTGAEVILLATNLQRSFVDLTKILKTADGDTVDASVEWFSYTGTVVADYSGMTPAEISVNREDLIWISFSDENGNSVDMTTLPKEDEWAGFWLPSDLAVRDGIDPTSYYSLDPGYRLVDSGVPFFFKIKNGWSVRLVNLTNGTTVEFTETDIPDDYAFVSSSLTLTTAGGTNPHTPTSQSGTSIKVTVEQADSGYTVTYVNKPDVAEKVTILKTNENGTVPLEGAEFTLYTAAGYAKNPKETAKTGLKSGADGKLELGWLPGGVYYLKETKAPSGYMVRSEPVKITVSDGTVTYDESTAYSQSGVGVSGSHVTGFTLVVTNWKGKTLPETGGVGTRAFTLPGAAMLAVSVPLLLRSFRRRKGVDTC